MEKNAFINSFSQCEKNFISRIYEDINLCKKTFSVIYSNEFVVSYVYNKLIELQQELGVKVGTYGVFDECERRLVSFSQEEETLSYPIDFLKITNKSKFKELGHKDYLGTLMSLGLKREVFGDLIVEGNNCYVPVLMEITNYIIANLNTINTCPCEVKVIDQDSYEIPKVKFEEKVIIITSQRLDNVISGITNLSRNNTSVLISNGSVLINHMESTRKDKIVKPQDVITIRGYGKFKLFDIIGETQKNRLKVLIKKYL